MLNGNKRSPGREDTRWAKHQLPTRYFRVSSEVLACKTPAKFVPSLQTPRNKKIKSRTLRASLHNGGDSLAFTKGTIGSKDAPVSKHNNSKTSIGNLYNLLSLSSWSVLAKNTNSARLFRRARRPPDGFGPSENTQRPELISICMAEMLNKSQDFGLESLLQRTGKPDELQHKLWLAPTSKIGASCCDLEGILHIPAPDYLPSTRHKA